MSAAIEKLLAEAMGLGEAEREELAARLLDSVEAPPGLRLEDREDLEKRAAEARRRDPGVTWRGPRDLVYTLELLRKAAGSTQAEVAESMGVTQARVSQIESASLDDLDPQWSTLTRYAAALGGTLELRVVIGGRAYRVR